MIDDHLVGRRIRVMMRTVSEERGTMVLPIWGNFTSRCGAIMNLTKVRAQRPDGSYHGIEDQAVDAESDMVEGIYDDGEAR